ncbi:hypothetical protein [Nocardia sp. NBC_01327]|uniref:hypothetical protein n=1 Tax=Nocardia sp. NBC_01327 TaxID=2903593 RepID=UPI002E11642A|nr:hypothetical protein OG326_33055 [Nocardia sp. NBC_01327]
MDKYEWAAAHRGAIDLLEILYAGRVRVVADWGNPDHRFLIEEGLAAAGGDDLVWTELGYQCLMNLYR